MHLDIDDDDDDDESLMMAMMKMISWRDDKELFNLQAKCKLHDDDHHHDHHCQHYNLQASKIRRCGRSQRESLGAS